MATVGLSIDARVATVKIDSPPVNVLSHAVRQGLFSAISEAQETPEVAVIILSCAGRTFIAGADVSEFGKPILPPELHEIIALLESGSKPVVAAIHGSALGGGLEIALACDYRVAVPSAKLGLPEITLGLIPGAGGTQRLPRLIGIEKALEMICSGRPESAGSAADLGLVDQIVDEDDLAGGAVRFAQSLLKSGSGRRRARDLSDKIAQDPGKLDAFTEFEQKNLRLFKGSAAPAKAIEALRASVKQSFDEGIATETRLFQQLYHGEEAAARRHAFFAERMAPKVPGLPAIASESIRSVGIVGGGTMGGGIAMNFLNIGMPVVLVEVSEAGLNRGLAAIRRNYERNAQRGGLTADEVDRRMRLLSGSLDFAELANADLVIEAVYESMDVKKMVFAQLDAVSKPDSILASNTSFLDIDEIATATSRPEMVLGLHFFSPANIMKLLEVVRGSRTCGHVLAVAMSLAKKIGKVPVLSGVCDGFIANRTMAARWHEADRLLLEGLPPSKIDRVLTDYGFAMGHFAMMDLVGLDVVGRDATERSVMGDLAAAGRLGLKSGSGYYDYDQNGQPCISEVVREIISDNAQAAGILPKEVGADEILERLLYPVVNEAAKVLEEGIALRASDIDIALITGYGWPVNKGGPTFWADTVGIEHIIGCLDLYSREYGDAFTPSALLRRLADQGLKLSNH